MEVISYSVFIGLVGAFLLFFLAQSRVLFPYLAVMILGLEYFSPGSPDSLFTIPKMGFAILLLTQVLTGRFRLQISTRGMFIPILVLAAFLMLTHFWTVNPTRTRIRSVSLILLIVSFLLVKSYVRSTEDLHHFWRAFLLYATASSVYAGFQLMTGSRAFVNEFGTRVGGLGVNPTEGAFYMGIGFLILLAYHFNLGMNSSWFRWMPGRLLLLGVIGSGILSTASRGGIVAFLVSTVAMLILLQGRSIMQRRRLFIILPVAFVVGLLLYFEEDMVRFLTIRMSGSSADQWGNRWLIWNEVLKAVWEKPWFGNGLNTCSVATSRYEESYTDSTHNTPLAVLLDGGLVGFVIFCWIFVRLVKLFLVMRSSPYAEIKFHGRIFLTLLILSSITMLTHDIMYNKLLWVLLALIEATAVPLLTTRVAPQDMTQPSMLPVESLAKNEN